MCYIKTEVRHAINIERGFGLITPLEMQFAWQILRKVKQLEAAPALIVQAPPGAAPKGLRSRLGERVRPNRVALVRFGRLHGGLPHPRPDFAVQTLDFPGDPIQHKPDAI